MLCNMQNVGGTPGGFGGREPRAWAEREGAMMANRDRPSVLAGRALPIFRRMELEPARFDAAPRSTGGPRRPFQPKIQETPDE